MNACFHRLAVLALLLAALSGCGSSEGGVVGSGISAATVSGQVVEVRESEAQARLAVPRLRVRIEETSELETLTGDDGAFVLTGDFAGSLTLRFENPGGRILGRLPIDVPAGSTLELEGIEIRPSLPGGVRAGEVRQRNLFGRVLAVDCGAGTLSIDDDVSRPFRIEVTAATLILRRDGSAASCDELRRGGVVLVEGVVVAEAGGAPRVRATRITVAPERPPRRPPGGAPALR